MLACFYVFKTIFTSTNTYLLIIFPHNGKQLNNMSINFQYRTVDVKEEHIGQTNHKKHVPIWFV